MDKIEMIILIASVAAIVILAAVLIPLLIKRDQLKKGIYGRKKVYSILKRFASFRNYKVVSDVTIKNGNKSAYYENILVSYYGLMIVKTVNDKSDYYGSTYDKQWAKVTGNVEKGKYKKEYVPNMITEIEDSVNFLREEFTRKKVYGIKMDSVIVLTRRKKGGMSQMYVSGYSDFKNIGGFKSLLRAAKYEKDNNVDVDAVVELINSISESKE
ncbi:MAG: NERD domain-containing protein [Oscillospiraceae bacterium]|nr:NERD domain-containing protein [Oscillospiraceae bacterium]